MEIVREKLKVYICKNLMGIEPNELNYEDSLFNEKRLDSISMADLLAFVEESFEIKVNPLDITFENFDSIELLSSYITKKQQT